MIDHGHLEGAVWYCDELQINKSLFGSEVGHVESLNMGLDHGLSSSREIIWRPLPLLPDPRPPNPPPLLRSQSLDDLHTAPAGDDKDPLEMCRSDGFGPQSAFPQLIDSTATAHGRPMADAGTIAGIAQVFGIICCYVLCCITWYYLYKKDKDRKKRMGTMSTRSFAVLAIEVDRKESSPPKILSIENCGKQ